MDMGVIVNNLASPIGEHLPCFLGDGITSEIIAYLQNLYKFQPHPMFVSYESHEMYGTSGSNGLKLRAQSFLKSQCYTKILGSLLRSLITASD